VELTDRGEFLDSISTAGEETGPGYYARTVTPGRHEYRLRTTERRPVRLFGWVTGNPGGVTYDMLGINGAQASMVLSWDRDLLADHIRRRNPGLIVLAYGTNESGNANLTEDSFHEVLLRVIGRLHDVAPQASILLVGPPDRGARRLRTWLPHAGVDRIVSGERTAATETACAFYDLRGKMGGKGVMHRWVTAGLAQGDHVHLTAAGYRLIAQALFADVMKHYERFIQSREPPPGSGQ
jgi:lysophospholipase L1-like esterase